MDEIILVIYLFLILVLVAGGAGAWWIYKAIKTIDCNIKDLQANKHSRLISNLDSIKSSISNSKRELEKSVTNNKDLINNHVTTENIALKQMIMAQFSNQTVRLVEDFENNRNSLSSLISIVKNLQSQTNKGIKDNSNKIEEFNRTISFTISETASYTQDYLQRLSSESNQHTNAILAGIDMIFKHVSEFNKTIEKQLKSLEETNKKNTSLLDTSISTLSSSLKVHKDNITSVVTQLLNTEKELHQKTKNSFNMMDEKLSKYLMQLTQLDRLYLNLQQLHEKLLGEEEKIAKQESSLAMMLSRHSQIFEITSEMNNTARDIFEFMKLYLIQSTLDNFKK